MYAPDVKPVLTTEGPNIIPELITVISNLSFSGSQAWKSQAAFSARVLDFSYAWQTQVFDQPASVYTGFLVSGVYTIIEAILLVITTLFTPCLWAALKTARVPSTAGLMSVFSSLGIPSGKGEEV